MQKPSSLSSLARDLVKSGDHFISTHGPREFHKKAHELLNQANLHEHYDFKELVKDTFSADFNLQQNYGSFQFSDLPITIAMGESCLLDLYFWRRRPTVIHDHHFTGAFQCLEGVNVDLEFEFIKSKSLGRFHELGQVNLLESRRLVKGDIAPIDLLDKFIHQNHHQADLTINACFRTPDIGATNLSNFLYSGLRFEKHPEVLNRVSRLMSFINIGQFDLGELNISVDDAINFMIRSYQSESKSMKFQETRKFMDHFVQNESGVNIDALMVKHDEKMDELENLYN